MPLEWEEVNSSLDPKAFTIRTAIERMENLGTDPMLSVLDQKPDLGSILQRLSAMMNGGAA
jgi:DNA primase